MGFGSFVKKAVDSVTGGDILGFGGSLISGGLSYAGQNSANAASLASTREQMEFQKEMRATQYQTAVDDLKKAGLNPMLAYQNGGAGNLSGASYTAQNAAGQGISSANETKMAMNALMKGREEIKLLEDQQRTQQSQTQLNRDLAQKAKNDAWLSASSAYNLDAMTPVNAALGQAQAAYYLSGKRNFDANSAATALSTYHSGLSTFTKEQESRRQRTIPGQGVRHFGNTIKDILRGSN